MDWIVLDQNWNKWRAVVTAVGNLRVPYSAGNFLTSWETVSLSRRTLLCGVHLVLADVILYLFSVLSNIILIMAV